MVAKCIAWDLVIKISHALTSKDPVIVTTPQQEGKLLVCLYTNCIPYGGENVELTTIALLCEESDITLEECEVLLGLLAQRGELTIEEHEALQALHA